MSEVWKPIPGVPNREVSSWGRIRTTHAHYHTAAYTLCKTHINNGHVSVNVPRAGDYHYRQFTAHRVAALVLLAFQGPKPDGYHIVFRDGNPLNCHASNLFYEMDKGMAEEEARKARNGWRASKLERGDVLRIRKLAARGYKQKEIADIYDIHFSYVSHILDGRRHEEVQ